MTKYNFSIFVLLIGSIGATEEVLGPPFLTIDTHPDIVTSVAVSPDGSKFVSVSRHEGANVKVWDVATGDELFSVDGGTPYRAMTAFTPDGMRLLTVGVETSGSHAPYFARFWDVETGGLIESHDLTDLLDGSYAVGPLFFSADGSRVLSTSGGSNRDGQFGGVLWEAATGERLFRFNIHHGSDSVGAYSTDGKKVALGGSSGAHLWVADSEFGVRVFELSSERVSAIAFSPNEAEIAIAAQNLVRVFDANTGREVSIHRGNVRTGRLAAFSPDLRIFFDSRGNFWDWRTGELLAKLPQVGGSIYSAAFSPDSARFITGHRDGAIRIWDISHLAAEAAVPEWEEH